MQKKKRAILLILALLVAILVTWYHFGQKTATSSEQTIKEKTLSQQVTVYAASKEEVAKQLLETFSQKTGIKVNIMTGPAMDFIQGGRRDPKGKDAVNAIDVFLTDDLSYLYLAREKKLLQPVTSFTLSLNIPEYLRDKEGYWFALSQRAKAIFYNKATMDATQLSTYEALFTEAWQGKLLMGSTSDVSNLSFLAWLIGHHGYQQTEQLIKGLVENLAQPPYEKESDTLKALANRKGAVAIASSHHYGHLQSSNDHGERQIADKIGIFFPNQEQNGAHINVSAGAVVKGAQHVDHAIKLLEFLSSKEAQEFYMEVNHDFSVNAQAYPAEIMKIWGAFKSDENSLATFPRHWQDAKNLASEMGWK